MSLESYFPPPTVPVPYVDTGQMIEVDRAMIEDFHIELIQMMENAGRNLAHVARHRFLNGKPAGQTIAVLAGTGGNGGGALVAARRLHNWGATVHVFIVKPDEAFSLIPKHQLDIVRRMGIMVAPAGTIADVPDLNLILDGVIGYSLKGNPRAAAGDFIRWTQQQAAPVLALDAPSGVDTTSGTVFDPAIKAAATMTLALPKEGLRQPGLKAQVGELYLADISVPPALYQEPALALTIGPIFAQSDVVRLW